MSVKKLVRDKIPEILKRKGIKFSYCSVPAADYLNWLKKKLREEVDEFIENESSEELADILEVINSLTDELGFTAEELNKIRRKKKRARGCFQRKIILEITDE